MRENDLQIDSGQTENTEFMWNVTPEIQNQVLNRIKPLYVATHLLAAFTDLHSWFHCAIFFWKKPPEVIFRGCYLLK